MDGLDDKDEFQKYMTEEETREYFKNMLEEHKGNDRMFVHCGKEWRVNMSMLPVISCPECDKPMAAVSIICTTCSCHPCICGLTTW